jgi:glutathione synthase
VSCDQSKLVMAQAYLPKVREGDKRILLLDGEPIGAVLRVPRDDETRSNLHVGGRATQSALDARDREIVATIAPKLRADGLYFVGIDVIGGMLTEVNVTSPTGIQEIDRLEGVRLESRVIDWLEKRVQA